MKKTTDILTFSLIIIGWISIVLLLYLLFQNGKENIQMQMEPTLREAINIDYYKRLNKKLVVHRPLGRKIKGSRIKTEKGTETIIFKDSLDEYIAEQLINQYVLAKCYPINPDKFNNIFSSIIKNNKIAKKTGIIYCFNGRKQYSNGDSISPQSAILTHPQIIDVKETVSVQAWVDCSWITIFQNTTLKALCSTISYSIVLLLVSILLYVYKDRKEDIIEYGENIEIGDLLLQKDMQRIYIKGEMCPIRRADFKLLLLFVQAPNHFLTREDIKNAFWPKEDNSDNKIYSHISTLKSSLKDFPKYQIIRETGRGYRLILPNKNYSNKILRFFSKCIERFQSLMKTFNT